MTNNLAKLSRDLYYDKKLVYNEVSGNEAMRKLFFEALDVPVGTKGRELKTAWDLNKPRVFAIIDTAVDAIVPTLVRDQFNSLCDFQNIGIGDEQHFTVKNPDLFRVALIASGTQDLRRQILHNRKYKVETDWYGIATYVEFEQFLAGNVDWSEYINKVADSLAVFIGTRIFQSIALTYSTITGNASNDPIGAKGTFSIGTLMTIARHVKARTNSQNVQVLGSSTALSNMLDKSGIQLSDRMKEQLNTVGYLTTVRGMDLVVMPDAYRTPGMKTFLIDDTHLLIVPGSEKIVDVVLEGDTYTEETQSGDNTGLIMDFNTRKKLGIAVKQSSVYGVYEFS